MYTSQNGWSASEHMALRPLVVNGVSFAPGIRDDDDVEIVLRYCMEQYNVRVEPLRNPGCWGYNFRVNRNDPDSLSNHSSATAVDANAPAHPNGVATTKTFTPQQIATCKAICAEVDNAVRWGGTYSGTPDAMHWEINTDPATLHAVAERLRNDMTPEQDARLKSVETKLDGLIKAEQRRGDNAWRRQAALAKALKDQGIDVDKILAAVEQE